MQEENRNIFLEYVVNNNNVLKFIRYENAPKYTIQQISSKRTKFMPRKNEELYRKNKVILRLKKKLEKNNSNN